MPACILGVSRLQVDKKASYEQGDQMDEEASS